MKKILKFLNDYLEETICIILMSVMTIIIFIQVIMLYDDTVLIGGELGEYADYFIEKVWRILDSQDIYREESAKDYVKVCEDGENVIAIGAAMYYINQAAVRL